MVDEAAGDTEKLAQDKTKLTVLHQRYREFSKAAGLRTQYERGEVAGFGERRRLANSTQSGIIEPTRPEEMPDVKRVAAKPIDVTEEYLTSAVPNSHVVQDLRSYKVDGTTYTVDGHNVVLSYSPHEKEIAELLERELGGELFMVPRINNPPGISSPDYLFRGKAYDLKTIGDSAGANTIYNRIKKARRQAQNFVVDVTKAQLTDTVIDEQIKKIYKMNETLFVDEIIFISHKKVFKVVKRA